MRCVACNVILTTQEATRKFEESGEFVDLCNKCLSTIDEDVTYTDGNHDQKEDDE
jgi:NAD-dependent SIR2 family protein deacetylase